MNQADREREEIPRKGESRPLVGFADSSIVRPSVGLFGCLSTWLTQIAMELVIAVAFACAITHLNDPLRPFQPVGGGVVVGLQSRLTPQAGKASAHFSQCSAAPLRKCTGTAGRKRLINVYNSINSSPASYG